MLLQRLHIQNFRGLQNIEVEGVGQLAVLAGPNAIGKTSVLEALRLAKSYLAPSHPGEAQETMNALGMVVPGTNLIDPGAITGEPGLPVRIRADFDLTETELELVFENVQQLAIQRLRTSLAAAQADNSVIGQFISTPEGRQKFRLLTQSIEAELVSIRANKRASIQLEFGRDGIGHGESPIAHEVLWFLSQRMPSYMHGLFSYFPADRAMPSGEANIQVGAGDTQAQRSSHLGQPATKYNRLKNFIVAQKLLGTEAAQQLVADFRLIFNDLLENKELGDIRVTPRGRVSVEIQDKRTGRRYDIDQLSSGEKGVILTFLLMRITVAPGGIVLLDEPELHLNAAVCRRLLDFISLRVCEERGVQVILCTHSPEILAAAYASDRATLLHLRTPTDATRIRKGDRDEVNEALQLLGARPVDMLYSRGQLYVEGPDDAELLGVGFSDIVRDLKVSKLGGRGEVEKHIRELQKAEREAKLDVDQCFLFDLDGRRSELASTTRVRIAQWTRYCFENFLLEPDAIYDASKARGGKPESLGWVTNRIRELAQQNMRDQALRRACERLPPSRMTLKLAEADGKSAQEACDLLAAQYGAIREAVLTMESESWKAEMQRLLKEESDATVSQPGEWITRCDGKRVLSAFYRESGLNCSLLAFKREILSNMASRKLHGWTDARAQLLALLGLNGGPGAG